jgi:hypothetical protein
MILRAGCRLEFWLLVETFRDFFYRVVLSETFLLCVVG